MREKILEIIEEQGYGKVTEEMSFSEMGMDSLDFMLLIQEIDGQIAPLDRKELQYCTSVGDLIKAVEWQLQPKQT